MAESSSSTVVDPAIFEHLQTKIDEDAQVREVVLPTVRLIKQVLPAISIAEKAIQDEVQTIAQLSKIASKHPYYKYNVMWTRDMQIVAYSVILCGWLGGFRLEASPPQGRLLTIEEVGAILDVPVNVKNRDTFHLTIEEYLHALINLIEELARDYHRPLQISHFVKDLHAGFQILNLKNDALRRRSDSIKYHVKKTEDVVYDISLRNLVPKAATKPVTEVEAKKMEPAAEASNTVAETSSPT
ncbi:MAG: hypothetical protein M1838_005577 [Thelocarpon superellum]|nr:MAG: hypothetical protein M1838_005577 [Thelocarpon superellum]